MLCYFLTCVLSLTMLFSFGQSSYLCNLMGETWINAMKHCSLAYGTLLTVDNFKEIEISELIKANVTEYWTSNIIEVAHAVEYRGCYVHSPGPAQTQLIPEGGINLIDCQNACNDNYNIYPFYGLYEDKCVCFYEESVKLNPSNQSCFQNCSINSLELCKDSTLIALYKSIRKNGITYLKSNIKTNKCVQEVNSTILSTADCQKNHQYQCNGEIKNGTFLNAIECGEKFYSNHETTWKPVFFPTRNKIQNQWSVNKNQLRMRSCMSLTVDKNRTYLMERNCTDLLPYICIIGHSNYQFYRVGKTLETAVKDCSLASGTLLTLDNLIKIEMQRIFKANITEFWTSNIIEVAYAVKYAGCYEYTTSASQNNQIPVGGEINLVDCQSACYNNYNMYSFYGLHGDKCVCFHRETVRLKPSTQNCFKNCSIDSLEFCKDSRLIALYKRIRYDSIELQETKLLNSKCVARVNSKTDVTENCQKNLQYRCKGKIHYGTFLNALETCGETLGSGHFWEPVFFPTLDRIKNQLSFKDRGLKIKICKSLKVDKTHIYIKERDCTESLPYICKTEDVHAYSNRLRECPVKIRQTSPPSITTQKISSSSDNHASIMSHSGGETHNTTSHIYHEPTRSYIENMTTRAISSGSSNDVSVMSHSKGEIHHITSHNHHEPTRSDIDNLTTQCNSFNNSNTAKTLMLSLSGVIAGSVVAGFACVSIVIVVIIFLYNRTRIRKLKAKRKGDTFNFPENREQIDSDYEDLQNRTQSHDYDVLGREAQYENTNGDASGHAQYESLQHGKEIRPYDELEMNDKNSSKREIIYANTVVKL